MRVSLQLSGTYRTLRDSYDHYREIFKNVELDIFLCISTVYDYTSQKYLYYKNWTRQYKCPKHDRTIMLNKDKLTEYLKNDYDFADFIVIDNDRNTPRGTGDDKSRAYYGMKKNKCNNLRKEYEKRNNFKYDIVIDSRTDWLLFNIKDFDMYYNGDNFDSSPCPYNVLTQEQFNKFGENVFVKKSVELKTEINLLPLFEDVKNNKKLYAIDMGKNGDHYFIWDGFAFGNPDVMNIYCNFNLSKEKNYPPNSRLWKGGYCPEARLQNYLLKEKINIIGLSIYNYYYYYRRVQVTRNIKKLI